VGSIRLMHHGGRDQVLLCLTRTQDRASELHEVELYETVPRSGVVGAMISKRRRVATAAAVTAFELVDSVILPGPIPLLELGSIVSPPLFKSLSGQSWATIEGRVVHTFSAALGGIIHAQQTLPGDLVIGPDARSVSMSQEKGAEATFIEGCVKAGSAPVPRPCPPSRDGWAAKRRADDERTGAVILGDCEADGTPLGIFPGTFEDSIFFSNPLYPGLLFHDDSENIGWLCAFTLDGACVWEFCPDVPDLGFVHDAAVLPGGLVAALSFTSLSVYKPLAPSQPWSLANVLVHEDKANAPTVVRTWDLSDLLEEVMDESEGYGKAREISDRAKAGGTLSDDDEDFDHWFFQMYWGDTNLRTTLNGSKLLANLWGQVR
jgi:hypothetical protein